MDEDLREQVALFRYGVIRDLIHRPLAPGEKEHRLEEISEREWEIPGSTRRRVGRSTARQWLALYEAHGFDGLKPLKRKDAGQSRGLSDAVQDLLLRLREQYPEAPLAQLLRMVHTAGPPGQERLSRTTVYRFFARHRRQDPAPGPASQPDARAFAYEHINDLWMADALHGPRLLVSGQRGRGPRTYLIALIDDASRLVPHAAFYRSENAACLLDALRHGFLRRGLPRRLYCDNGAAFRSRHLEIVCARLGISLIHSRPRQPRGRGKIERFFRTVRSAFLPVLESDHRQDLGALNRVFWAWLEEEYHSTPHGGLAESHTPRDRFLAEVALVRSAPEDLERLLRFEVSRRVGQDRTVRLDGQLYEAPDGYAGERVELLYDPYEPTSPVHLRRPGQREEVRLRPLDAALNARRRPRPAAAPEAPAEAPAPSGIRYLDLLAERHFGGGETEGEP